MFKFKCCFLIFIIIISFSSHSFAEPMYPLLNQQDIDHFCDVFPYFYKETSKLGFGFNEDTGSLHGLSKVKQAAGILQILERYNSKPLFFVKMKTIVQGFFIANYDFMKKEHSRNIHTAMHKLTKNPWIDAKEKRKANKNFKAKVKQTEILVRRLRQEFHPKDLELIKRHMERIKIALKRAKQDK